MKNNNNNLKDEDLLGLYPVDVNAMVNNLKKYGIGNRNRSPNIRSPRLNDLPVKRGFKFNNNYEREEPVLVPKLKLKLPAPRIIGGKRVTRRRGLRRVRHTRRDGNKN
jgi:hypothetical protein